MKDLTKEDDVYKFTGELSYELKRLKNRGTYTLVIDFDNFGCGMCATPTHLRELAASLIEVADDIEKQRNEVTT